MTVTPSSSSETPATLSMPSRNLRGVANAWLVSGYSALVHRGRRLTATVEAWVRGRIDRCDVCGSFGPRPLEPRLMAPALVRLWNLSPELTRAFVEKESGFCGVCGSNLRARRLARVILDLLAPPDPTIRCLDDWWSRADSRCWRIALFNAIPGVDWIAARHAGPHVLRCEYEPSRTDDPTIRREDLTRLNLDTGSLDMVVTSETLEHVPDLNQAWAELRRVLRPGGWHVFTVPQRPDQAKTVARARLSPSGKLEALDELALLYHPGGDWGWPVFTEFGLDLNEVLDRAGFDATLKFGPVSHRDVAQVWVAQRRADSSPVGTKSVSN